MSLSRAQHVEFYVVGYLDVQFSSCIVYPTRRAVLGHFSSQMFNTCCKSLSASSWLVGGEKS